MCGFTVVVVDVTGIAAVPTRRGGGEGGGPRWLEGIAVRPRLERGGAGTAGSGTVSAGERRLG